MPLTISQKPLAEVTASLSAKTPIGSVLNSADWQNVPVALRESAFMAAGVESVRALSEAQAGLQKILELTRGPKGEVAMDRSKFIAEMQKLSNRLGLRNPDPAKRGSVQDFGSERRLQLIFEQQIGQAQSKAYYLSGQDPDILDAWPAQELVRLRNAKAPRDWTRRWSEAGGKFYGSRMIALKTDPIWTKISRFGRPWPPFDYGSGMGLDEIDRESAEALGLIKPGERIEPSLQRDQEEIAASVKGLSPDMQAALKTVFGNQIRVDGEQARWRGSDILALGNKAITDPGHKERVPLGSASPDLIAAAKQIGEDLTDFEFDISADDIRHIIKQHGGASEIQRGQIPVLLQHLATLPNVLQAPDQVTLGNEPDVISITKDIAGRMITFWLLRSRKKKRANPRTLFIKKQ
jgi:hypothetical protein